jgi:hypothetical protein
MELVSYNMMQLPVNKLLTIGSLLESE